MTGQVLPQNGIKQPSETAMPATTLEYDFEELPQRFVGIIDQIAGKEKTARLIGVGAGTVENLRRGRRKEVGRKLFQKIRGAVILVLQSKKRWLEAEIALALASGESADDRRLVSAAAALAQIEAVLKGAPR